jgi:hypothetical protein
MTHRPSDTDAPPTAPTVAPPLGPGGASDTGWIMVAAIVIGVLTVLLLITTVAVTRSGPTEKPKASAPASSATPTAVKTTAAAGSTNIECDGTFIVELARSTTASADADVEKAAEKEKNGKFLDAAASCSTYKAEGVRRVAYIGPFDTLAKACAARVKNADMDAVLHKMDAEQVGDSYCVCRDIPTLPVLQSGAGTNGDVATLLTISEVQRILKALGYFKPKIDGSPYGPRSVSAVQAFQTDRKLYASGVVDQPTWTALRRSKHDGRPFC